VFFPWFKEGKMKNKLLIIAIFTLFTACFNGQQGNEGTLIISFGGGGRGRVVDVEWPPFFSGDDGILFLYPTKFIVTLNSPTGKREESFYFIWDIFYADTKISLTVASGRWNVHIETIIYDSFLYAAGSGSVDVKAGQANSVPIEMKRKYYEIGEKGPGGGIIFHVDPEGFTMKDNGQTCHYLEAAPSDILVKDGPEEYDNPQSGSSADFYVPDTRYDVGEGRRNTQIIVDALALEGAKNMAAQLCADAGYGGFNDWFLPSSDELNLMYINLRLHLPPLGNFRSGEYWSSSFGSVPPSITIKGQMFADGVQTSPSPNFTDLYARAIRAF
jgi:hypothetical protein